MIILLSFQLCSFWCWNVIEVGEEFVGTVVVEFGDGQHTPGSVPFSHDCFRNLLEWLKCVRACECFVCAGTGPESSVEVNSGSSALLALFPPKIR